MDCLTNRNFLESEGAEGDTPVRARRGSPIRHLSRAGHVESCPNPRGPSRKAKDCRRPIADQYREGKVGSTPGRGVKQNLKPCACKRSEHRRRCDGVPFA